MAIKTIKFTVAADGSVSPRTEQNAGVQGEHNALNVEYDVSALQGSLEGEIRYRVQIIDGAGGFHSSAFLELSADNTISYTVPREVTNVGGRTFVYLIISQFETAADGTVTEASTLYTVVGKLNIGYSGIGSPSENAYRLGISGALYGAQQAAESAKTSADSADGAAEAAEASKNDASQSALTAEPKAKDAIGAAETAKSEELIATTSATAAANSAGAAKMSEANAKISEANAEGSAEAAGGYANNAQQAAAVAIGIMGDVEKISEALEKVVEIQNSIIG